LEVTYFIFTNWSLLVLIVCPLMAVVQRCRYGLDCGKLAIVGQGAINWFLSEIEPLFANDVPPQLMTIIRALLENTFDMFTRFGQHRTSAGFISRSLSSYAYWGMLHTW
jgi:hypothetical protein